MINPRNSSYKSDFAISDIIIFAEELYPSEMLEMYKYMFNPGYAGDQPILTHFNPSRSTYISNSFIGFNNCMDNWLWMEKLDN